MPTKKAVTPINIKYNANTFQSIRVRTVGDRLTAADILINIIIIPILSDVRNLRGFMVICQDTFYVLHRSGHISRSNAASYGNQYIQTLSYKDIP
jgi:hypothetical protein